MLQRRFEEKASQMYMQQKIKGFSPEAEKILFSYSWPGNVRELKNLVERFVVLGDTELISPEDLPGWLHEGSEDAMKQSDSGNNRFILPKTGISLEDLEKDIIIQATNMAKSRAEAAKLLNISYETLRYQLKQFGL